MPVVVETKGLAPRFMDNNQVVPEYDSKGLDCDPGINASFILKVISESMGNLAIIKTARVDVFIDGEKCSDYNGMVFSEQFYAESMDGNTELIQCWHAPPMLGETFSVVKKVIQITNNITSFKIKEVGTCDFLLSCYKTPHPIKSLHRQARASKRRRPQ